MKCAAVLLCILGLCCCLWGCAPAAAITPTQAPTIAAIEPPATHAPTVPPATEAPIKYGWITEDGVRRFRTALGEYYTGWLGDEVRQYYFNEEGIMQTGWLELDGLRYYFHPDGVMAKGKSVIDGKTYYFAHNGALVYLVNPWNPVPEGYTPDLVHMKASYADWDTYVDRSCYDALAEMMTDCNRYSGARVRIISAYRSNADQADNFYSNVNNYIAKGYTREQAEKQVATIVAVPGTSEHELGLAVDIIDTRLNKLTHEQATLSGQKWLMEHCWRYGFILRYPAGKTDVTGIIYEPWHYRYVGKEVAAALYESGLTLEEYMEQISK